MAEDLKEESKVKRQNEAVSAAIEKYLNPLANIWPEVNYWVFSSHAHFLPYILEKHAPDITIPQPLEVGHLWNQLDAFCALLLGMIQLRDWHNKTTHRSTVTGVKGAMNVANGVQLCAGTIYDTVTGGAAFGGPAFALCFGIGWLHAWDETARRYKRYHDPHYWLKDVLAERKNLEEQILLQSPKLSDSEADETSTFVKSLESKKAALEHDLNIFRTHIQQTQHDWDFGKALPKSATLPAEILQEEGKAFGFAAFEQFCWTFSFGGMLVLAMADPKSIFYNETIAETIGEAGGKIIVGIASGLYLCKNLHQLHGRFFAPPKPLLDASNVAAPKNGDEPWNLVVTPPTAVTS